MGRHGESSRRRSVHRTYERPDCRCSYNGEMFARRLSIKPGNWCLTPRLGIFSRGTSCQGKTGYLECCAGDSEEVRIMFEVIWSESVSSITAKLLWGSAMTQRFLVRLREVAHSMGYASRVV